MRTHRAHQSATMPRRNLTPSMIRRATGDNEADKPIPTILARESIGSPLGDARLIFDGAKFAITQQVVAPACSSGFGYHPTEDRVVWLLQGSAFVTTDEGGGKVEHRALGPGQFVRVPAGMPHGYATAGETDAVLLLIEGPRYAQGWVAIKAAIGIHDPVIVPGAQVLASMPTSIAPPLAMMDGMPVAAMHREQHDPVSQGRARAALIGQRMDHAAATGGGMLLTAHQAQMPDMGALNAPLSAPPPMPMSVNASILSEL